MSADVERDASAPARVCDWIVGDTGVVHTGCGQLRPLDDVRPHVCPHCGARVARFAMWDLLEAMGEHDDE